MSLSRPPLCSPTQDHSDYDSGANADTAPHAGRKRAGEQRKPDEHALKKRKTSTAKSEQDELVTQLQAPCFADRIWSDRKDLCCCARTLQEAERHSKGLGTIRAWNALAEALLRLEPLQETAFFAMDLPTNTLYARLVHSSGHGGFERGMPVANAEARKLANSLGSRAQRLLFGLPV